MTDEELKAIGYLSEREASHTTFPGSRGLSKYGRCACPTCITDRHAMAEKFPQVARAVRERDRAIEILKACLEKVSREALARGDGATAGRVDGALAAAVPS